MVPQLEAGRFQIHKRNAGSTEVLALERDKKRTTLGNALFPKHVDLLLASQEMVHRSWSPHVDARFENLSREQASLLAGTGFVNGRKPNIAEQTVLYAQKILELAKDNTMVTWIDNYNQWRYSRNVARQRNISINATCVAMLPVAPSDGIPRFGGVKTIPELLSAIGHLPTMLRLAARSFRGKVRQVWAWHLRLHSVRVPLVIRQYDVTMVPWWTCDVLPINISSRDGLLEACSDVDEWRTKTGKNTSPVLCDVDLYYRMLKWEYNVTYLSVATNNCFAHTPLLFGLWHS